MGTDPDHRWWPDAIRDGALAAGLFLLLNAVLHALKWGDIPWDQAFVLAAVLLVGSLGLAVLDHRKRRRSA